MDVTPTDVAPIRRVLVPPNHAMVVPASGLFDPRHRSYGTRIHTREVAPTEAMDETPTRPMYSPSRTHTIQRTPSHVMDVTSSPAMTSTPLPYRYVPFPLKDTHVKPAVVPRKDLIDSSTTKPVPSYPSYPVKVATNTPPHDDDLSFPKFLEEMPSNATVLDAAPKSPALPQKITPNVSSTNISTPLPERKDAYQSGETTANGMPFRGVCIFCDARGRSEKRHKSFDCTIDQDSEWRKGIAARYGKCPSCACVHEDDEQERCDARICPRCKKHTQKESGGHLTCSHHFTDLDDLDLFGGLKF